MIRNAIFAVLLLIPVMLCGQINNPPSALVFNVQTYGAKGDGVTDDTTAIQTALNAVGSAGGTVYIPKTANFYKTSTCLTVSSGTTLQGDGFDSTIQVASAGITLVNHTCFGIINIYNVTGVRVTGLHIIGTKLAADSNHTPKFIYLDAATNVTIDHNYMEKTLCEGIWSSNASGIAHVDISHNYLTDVGTACFTPPLPAIQTNADQVTIIGNEMVNVGTGIGGSGTNQVITGNRINGLLGVGISTGDATNEGPTTVTGNNVIFTADPTGATVRVGYLTDAASAGTSHPETLSGNNCTMTDTNGNGRCFRLVTHLDGYYTGNTAEVIGTGKGFEWLGSSPAGTTIVATGNTCRGTSESAVITCFIAIPNGVGNVITVFSSNNRAYGITRANASFAFDYNNVGGGTITAYSTHDLAGQGNIRFGTTSYNSSGFYDNVPFTLGTATTYNQLIAGGLSFDNSGTSNRLNLTTNGTVARITVNGSVITDFNSSGSATLLYGPLNFQNHSTIGNSGNPALDSSGLYVTDGSFGSTAAGMGIPSACETSFAITTLSTIATTTNTGLNCLPINAVIDAVVYRITTTITTAANFTIGDATIAARFCASQSTLTAGTTGICFAQADQTGTSGPRQTAAAAVRVTTNVNPGAGAIRLIVYYHTWTAPTS